VCHIRQLELLYMEQMSSLENALRILDLLADDRPVLRVSEVCRDLALPKSSASRLLRVLGEAGLLERGSDGGYAAGPRGLKLAEFYLGRRRLPPAVDEALDALVEGFGFTGFASVLVGRQIVLLRVRQGSYPLRYVREIGTRLAAWRTAMGRALLARLPDADVRARLDSVSDLDPERLLLELAEIRQRGIVVSQSAFTPGATTIAAAFDAEEPVAIAIAYPDSAANPELRQRMEAAVLARAREMERAQASRRADAAAISPA
jgi:DNA-binding IclR family transcriptional regulator